VFPKMAANLAGHELVPSIEASRSSAIKGIAPSLMSV
jgi:hypothetical protein